jgi:hypothetical protein|tara:strand:- start:396 stop:788 length:393 start_codon:yes stop_codon:yes gene_type:complete
VENVLIFVMGAICGVSIYRGLVVLLGVGQGILIFRQAEYMCLQLLALSLEDASNIKTTKQTIINKLNYPDNVIKFTRNEDQYNLDKWKNEAIRRLIERYPPNYKKIVQYRNWSGAMKYFEDQRKKTCNLN